MSDAFDAAVTRLRSALPASIQKKWAEEEKRRDDLCKQFVREASRCVELLACAIQSPIVARLDMEEACKHFLKARGIAEELDPKEAA